MENTWLWLAVLFLYGLFFFAISRLGRAVRDLRHEVDLLLCDRENELRAYRQDLKIERAKKGTP
jgi:hypothetical protein